MANNRSGRKSDSDPAREHGDAYRPELLLGDEALEWAVLDQQASPGGTGNGDGDGKVLLLQLPDSCPEDGGLRAAHAREGLAARLEATMR